MEEGQNNESQNPVQDPMPSEQSPQRSGVSFPTVGAPKKSGGPKTLLIVGILILVGVLGFVIYKSASKKSSSATTPTPFDNLTAPEQGSTNSTATPSAAPKVDKSTVNIQIQNGTGITGEAAYLQTQLKSLGYTNITISNASETGLTTTQVTFSSTLDSGVVSEITQKLNSLYQNVNTSTSSTQSVNVLIITGLRKGATPLPQATPTPVDTSSPTATPTATP